MFEILVTIVTVIFAIVSLLMILIILLQSGKGGMGTALGGGASQSVFGGGGSADVLAKATQVFAASFMICSIFLAYASANNESSRLKEKSQELEGQSDLLGEDQPIDYERLGNWQPLPPADAAVVADNPAAIDPLTSDAEPPAEPPELELAPTGTPLLPPTDLKLKTPFSDGPAPTDAPSDADAPAPEVDAKAPAATDTKAADSDAKEP